MYAPSSEPRRPDDELRTVPVVTVESLRAVGAPTGERGIRSWTAGGTLTVSEPTGRVFTSWYEPDLDFTLDKIDQEEPFQVGDQFVEIVRHSRSDGTPMCTWLLGGREITFVGRAYDAAWEGVRADILTWINTLPAELATALRTRRDDFN